MQVAVSHAPVRQRAMQYGSASDISSRHGEIPAVVIPKV